MKLLTATSWLAIAMILFMVYTEDQQFKYVLGSIAAAFVFIIWMGQTSLIEDALGRQRVASNQAITDAYEKGRQFGAIHAEDVQEAITLARERERAA